MKGKGIGILMGVTLCVGLISGIQNTPDHKVLFEKAKFAMETKGDLQGAIKLFQEIVAKYPQEKEYAAKAQLYIGLCYEKLGNSEAVKAYELVLKNFADRPEEVAVARERLAALKREKPTELALERIFPQDIYLECPSQSTDGTKIAAIDFSAGQNIAIYDSASQHLQLITHFTWSGQGSCFAYFPVFSPNGREIVYSIGCWESNYKTQDATELHVSTPEAKSRLLFRAEHASIIPCCWLPDGKNVIALLQPTDKPASLGLVPVTGGTFKTIHAMQGSVGRLLAAPADLSPDGRYLVFQDGPADGKQDIFIMDMEGGSVAAVSDHPADDKEPRWSPDGKHVVFLSNRHGSWGLWGVPIAHGRADGQSFLIKEGLEGSCLFNWTKNGLAFSVMINMRDVYTAMLDTAALELSDIPKPLTYSPTGINSDPVWSPDGTHLAFASFSLEEPGQGSVVLLPASGGETKKFPLSPLVSKGIVPRELLWLPDGSGLGFSAQDRKTDQWYLCKLVIESGEWKIQPAKTAQIRWDLDGSGYYFFTERGLFEKDLKTENERLVYAAAETLEMMGRYNLAFSVDRRQAAWVNVYHRDKASIMDVHEIAVLDISSGKIRTFEGDLDRPAWAPDGRHLLALGSFTKNNLPTAIYVLSLKDGTSRMLNLGNGLPKGSEILSVAWSPDGRRVAFDARMMKSENLLIRNVIPQDAQGKPSK